MPQKRGLPPPPDQQSSIANALAGPDPQSASAPNTNFLTGTVKMGMSPYRTPLTPVDEMRFQNWLKQYRTDFKGERQQIPFEDSPTADYDMRGYWQALQRGDPRAVTAVNPADNLPHFPDIWKTPYHKTFSRESQYATPSAPRWVGDNVRGYALVDSLGNILHDERLVK